jgi:HEAT repeat protein
MLRRLFLSFVFMAWLPEVLNAQEAEPRFQGRPLRDWIDQLRASDEDARQAAVQALGQMGSAAAPAVPALLEALRAARPTPLEPEEPDEWEEDRPFRIARERFREGDTGWTSDPRAAIVDALAGIGSPAQAGLQQLLALMTDRNAAVARRAAIAVGNVGETGVPALCGAVTSPEPSTREAALHGLRAVAGRSEAARAALLAAIKDPDPGVRKTATRAALRLGNEAVPALTEALRTGDAESSLRAADVLLQIEGAGLPAVLQVVRDGTPSARRAAVLMLGKHHTMLCKPFPDLIPELIAALKSDDEDLRIASVGALRFSLGEDPAVASALREASRALARDRPATRAPGQSPARPRHARTVPAREIGTERRLPLVGGHRALRRSARRRGADRRRAAADGGRTCLGAGGLSEGSGTRRGVPEALRKAVSWGASQDVPDAP